MIVTFTSAHSPRFKVATAFVPSLVGREQDTVVIDPAVVRGVKDVGVEAILVYAEVEDAHAHLFGRAVRLRHVGPAAGVGGSRAGESRLTGKTSRMIELQPE